MQKFQYRSPRFAVDFPIQLTVEQSILHGRCREVSKEGMRVELRQSLSPGVYGTVSLNHQNRSLEICIRVAHTGTGYDGLEFVYKTDQERVAVAEWVASLAALPRKPRLILLSPVSAGSIFPEVGRC
jgi:hypothetical protein